jgi:hypothetical protein
LQQAKNFGRSKDPVVAIVMEITDLVKENLRPYPNDGGQYVMAPQRGQSEPPPVRAAGLALRKPLVLTFT